MTIDINCSFGPGLASQPKLFGPLWGSLSGAELVEELDRTNVGMAAIAAPGWLGGDFVDPEYEQANRSVHDASKHQSRLLGIGRVNPKFGKRAIAQAKRCFEEFGVRGLLLDVEVDRFLAADVASLDPFFELCRQHKVPMLSVTGIHPGQPMIFVPWARAHPDVSIILLRMGSYVPEDALIAARHAKNIYLETSGQGPGQVWKAVSTLGSDRILFGSGYPYADLGVEREKIASFSNLEPEDSEVILRGNAEKLLGIRPAILRGRRRRKERLELSRGG